MDPGNWATSLAGGSQVRLRAVDGRAVVEPDGDRAAVAVHAARRRRRARPRAGLPRFLSALGLAAAVAVGGSRDHRDRPCRSDRHRDRPQSAVSHSARDRRSIITAADVFLHPGAAGVRLPLDRGVRGGDAGRDRGLLCASRSRWPIRTGARSCAGFAPSTEIFANPRDALSRARHSRRHRDAA